MSLENSEIIRNHSEMENCELYPSREFWFSTNPNFALPVVWIPYTNIRININIEPECSNPKE